MRCSCVARTIGFSCSCVSSLDLLNIGLGIMVLACHWPLQWYGFVSVALVAMATCMAC